MNVKVSITLPLDQIPEKAGELLDEELNRSLSEMETFRFTTVNVLLNGTTPTADIFDHIHKLRSSLFLLDSRLAETESLISGWMKHKLPKSNTVAESQGEQDEEG